MNWNFTDRMTCKSLFGFYPAMVDQYHGLKNREDRLRVYDKYLQKFSEYHISASASATYGRRGWYPKWNGDEPVFNWKEWDEGMEQGFNKYHFTAMRISGGLGLGGGDAQRRRLPEIGGVKEGDPRFRGGALCDHPHIFDMIRHMTGSDFESIYVIAIEHYDEMKNDTIRGRGSYRKENQV
mgnify:CR=1 FL=1